MHVLVLKKQGNEIKPSDIEVLSFRGTNIIFSPVHLLLSPLIQLNIHVENK